MLLTNDCILQSAGRYLLIMPTNKKSRNPVIRNETQMSRIDNLFMIHFHSITLKTPTAKMGSKDLY